MNSLLKSLLGQGAQAGERESTTAQSPRRPPVLSAFKSLALIPEPEYGNSGTGRKHNESGEFATRSCSKYFSDDTLSNCVVVPMLMCFCSGCFKHLLLVALKVIPKPCLSNPLLSQRFYISSSCRDDADPSGQIHFGGVREGSRLPLIHCLSAPEFSPEKVLLNFVRVWKQMIFHPGVAAPSVPAVTERQCHVKGGFYTPWRALQNPHPFTGKCKTGNKFHSHSRAACSLGCLSTRC